MGAKAYFLDNQTYSAQDVNNVFAQLTCGGVSLYQQKESALIDYETAVSNFITPGVDLYNVNSCKIVSTADGKLKASKGTCWMNDGSCIVIDSDGLEVEGRVAGTKQYVYMQRDLSTDSINLIATSVTLTDAVMLAQVNADGSIVDMRTFAKAKIGVTSGNIYVHDTDRRIFGSEHTINTGDYLDGYELPATEFDIGHSGFNYAVSKDKEDGHFVKMLSKLENGKDVAAGWLTSTNQLYIRKDGSKITYSLWGKTNTLAWDMDVWFF